jgi:hypothetical protein
MRHSQQVRTDAHERRLRLQLPERLQQSSPTGLIPPAGFEVRKQPRGPFQAKDPSQPETCTLYLGAELLGPVEVCGGEVFQVVRRIVVQPPGEVPLDDGHERRIGQEVASKAVESRCESGDAGREENTSGLQNAKRLPQGHVPVARVLQMIERAQQQHGVSGAIRPIEAACVPDGAARDGGPGVCGLRAGLVDHPRDRIDEMNLVAALREPPGVDAGAAAHVQHHAWRRGQEALDELPSRVAAPPGRCRSRCVPPRRGWDEEMSAPCGYWILHNARTHGSTLTSGETDTVQTATASVCLSGIVGAPTAPINMNVGPSGKSLLPVAPISGR